MDIKRIIVATCLSAAILIGFDYFVPQHAKDDVETPSSSQTQPAKPAPSGKISALPAPVPGGPPANATDMPRKDAGKIAIEGPDATGAISLRGARFDSLVLTHYRETLDKDSPLVRLLEPQGGPQPSFVEIGWQAPAGSTIRLPDADTDWTSSDTVLSPDHPVTMQWNNGQGLVFRIAIRLDRRYLFAVTQTVQNDSGQPVALTPFQRVERDYKPVETGGMIVHEGPLSVMNDRLDEETYKTMRKGATKPDNAAWSAQGVGGWAGLTDRYWLTAVIPDQKAAVTAQYRYIPGRTDGAYIVDTRSSQPIQIATGSAVQTASMVFVGAKEVNLLDQYTNDLHIPYFYKAVDFGWFAFLTRPMFHILHWLYSHVGNFGIALLILTLIIKLILYPLATKSFASMARMRTLAPRIQAIREHNKGDQMAQNQQIMALYKEEGVNPAGGCLPLLVQAPVAFCLYKVLNITIEMRQAPFYGWIRDLSAPDPTTIFNLFGLLPFNPSFLPEMLHVGVWPILFGITIWLMQRQSMVSMDPAQQKIMQFMPVIYTIFLGRLSAGIVIYYTWNNVLSYGQQKLIQMQIDRGQKGGSAGKNDGGKGGKAVGKS
ncbi:membrane protein insertase YidC [Swaminathania salitolerans]|uniref:Membrane protein insertase YidC n=1 Tax=Swaminathania salitolerans TaxID=182838 RepID=A0A511BM74_9PROT|nr:membrane protein insertase YidC [Swaminathania salitolerans]GBQ15661.1 translocase inner membrane component YidC [Swaminathania salitolerans LMG 21291]GEL01439.1 membrane protein insertase YidC [Swaminathania salitolerans]